MSTKESRIGKTIAIKPPVELEDRIHIYLQKIRAFIKEVPVKSEEWRENKKCALNDVERLIAMFMPVHEHYDPCQGQIIRLRVKKNIIDPKEFPLRKKK